MSFGVVLFYTTSSVMRAEKVLLGKGFNIKLIPTPRQFSSDCGIALRFDWDEYDRIRQVLDLTYVETENIYMM
jgi:hypothetical protein